jgi:hypothetical protein
VECQTRAVQISELGTRNKKTVQLKIMNLTNQKFLEVQKPYPEDLMTVNCDMRGDCTQWDVNARFGAIHASISRFR